MAEGLQKLVPFFSDPVKKKKKQSENKKKIEFVDKEVWNITGGFFPLVPTNNNKGKDEKPRQWSFSKIVLKNEQISPIPHWVPFSEKDDLFSCEKYNIKIDIVDFTKEEYDQYLQDLDPSWTYEETLILWELCNKFDLRFIVIADRYDEKYCRGIEDLKHRFYSVTQKILEKREMKMHPLYNYMYDPEYERVRKFELEKYLMRVRDFSENEKQTLEELRKIEVSIKKEEKENVILQKYLKEQEADNDEECVKILHQVKYLVSQLPILSYFIKVPEESKVEVSNPSESICFLRGKWLSEPLPISEKMNKKLAFVLNELCVPSDFIATEENEIIFEELREQIFGMFNLQKAQKKKESVKKLLEDRKKKIMEDLQNIESSSLKRINPFSAENGNIDKIQKKLKQ